MKRIQSAVYQTSDGRLWLDQLQATAIELELLVDPRASGSPSIIFNRLVEQRDIVISLLKKLPAPKRDIYEDLDDAGVNDEIEED